jgi:hypothetical protein
MQVKLSWKQKAASGEKTGEVYNPARGIGIPGDQPVCKSDYCKCSACDMLVIIASGSLLD